MIIGGIPTLLKTNVIIPHMGESKNEISNIRGIDYVMNWFNIRINNLNEYNSISDRIIILKSATGSGKSTVFPSEFYFRFYKTLKKNIIVTQPRILTAISIPKTISNVDANKKENRNDGMGIELYKNIGYQTKEYIRKPLEKGILFCTIGVLLQFLKNMPLENLFKKYGCIIIDEAHERSTNLDLIFYYLKQIYLTNKIEECPFLVIASATMNVNKYAKYYNTNTIFEITGTSHPIETHFLKYDSSNIYNSIIDIVKQIHINNKNDEKYKSDIIIFIPSKSFINKLKNKILELNKELNDKLYPIALDSEAYRSSGEDYLALFNKIDNLVIDTFKPTRKVIIATNIAETGITIESLKYCIDSGLVNQLEYNPIYNNYNLIIKPVTRSMALQRKGRVGREHPGIFYPIYTEKIFNNIQDIQYPEIFTEDLTPILLNIILIKYKSTIDNYINSNNLFDNIQNNNKIYDDIKFLKNINIYNLDLLDLPSNISINNSLNKLYNFGLIYGNGYPTRLGLIINKIRNISIENAIMIMSGYHYGCNILDLITIAAFNIVGKSKLILKNFKSFNTQFNEVTDKIKNIDKYNYNKLKTRLFISCEFIDFLLFFYKFQEITKFYKNNILEIIKFCEENKINYYELLNLIELRDEIIKDFVFNMNLNPNKNNHINIYNLLNTNNDNMFIEAIEEIIKIKKCLYSGFKFNIAIYNDESKQYIINNSINQLHSNSYLIKNLPILENGKNFIINKPKVILFDSAIIKKNSETNNYEFTVANSISVLSGYINIDLNEFN
jgi:HrpA-like RNA helicase